MCVKNKNFLRIYFQKLLSVQSQKSCIKIGKPTNLLTIGVQNAVKRLQTAIFQPVQKYLLVLQIRDKVAYDVALFFIFIHKLLNLLAAVKYG